MIGYLEGTLLKKKANKILLLVDHVGYEVLLPAVVMASISDKAEGAFVFFYIYHHQTERQPLPVLIGFNSEEEKEFFQLLISVEAIGPLKAAQSLTIPVEAVAAAIENGNVDTLKQLKGIGARTAQKIVATLRGKVGRFVGAGGREAVDSGEERPQTRMMEETITVLVEQLGYARSEARRMAAEAMQAEEDITAPEELLEVILKNALRP